MAAAPIGRQKQHYHTYDEMMALLDEGGALPFSTVVCCHAWGDFRPESDLTRRAGWGRT
jgi:hypothetical protein